MERKQGFVYKPYYHEVLSNMPEDERHVIQDAILNYGILQKEPEGLTGYLRSYFVLLREDIDATQGFYYGDT